MDSTGWLTTQNGPTKDWARVARQLESWLFGYETLSEQRVLPSA